MNHTNFLWDVVIAKRARVAFRAIRLYTNYSLEKVHIRRITRHFLSKAGLKEWDISFKLCIDYGHIIISGCHKDNYGGKTTFTNTIRLRGYDPDNNQ